MTSCINYTVFFIESSLWSLCFSLSLNRENENEASSCIDMTASGDYNESSKAR
jgi:hypothetical protein